MALVASHSPPLLHQPSSLPKSILSFVLTCFKPQVCGFYHANVSDTLTPLVSLIPSCIQRQYEPTSLRLSHSASSRRYARTQSSESSKSSTVKYWIVFNKVRTPPVAIVDARTRYCIHRSRGAHIEKMTQTSSRSNWMQARARSAI